MIEVQNANGVSFKLVNGKIYGVLGAEGSGKTTLLNLLTGCKSSAEGTVKINGFDMQKEPQKAKQCIGYLPATPPVYDKLTLWEYLSFVAEAKGISYERAAKQTEDVLELTGISALQNRVIEKLSRSQQVRVGLAQALLGNPEIVVLDEPTEGLPPNQAAELRALLCRLGKIKTVIVSSKKLAEMTEICDRVLVFSHGTLIANASVEELRSGLVRLSESGDYELTQNKEDSN